MSLALSDLPVSIEQLCLDDCCPGFADIASTRRSEPPDWSFLDHLATKRLKRVVFVSERIEDTDAIQTFNDEDEQEEEDKVQRQEDWSRALARKNAREEVQRRLLQHGVEAEWREPAEWSVWVERPRRCWVW